MRLVRGILVAANGGLAVHAYGTHEFTLAGLLTFSCILGIMWALGDIEKHQKGIDDERA